MSSLGEGRRRVPAAVLAIAVAVASFVSTAPAAAEETGSFDPSGIVFPVIGEVTFVDSFSDPRSGGRTHGATDIMGAKMLPVVAAADGVVRWIGSTCCYLSLSHGGGWETWYIHLNNDSPGTDDGAGWGIADGIEPGVPVRAGQLIGWVGDSGNAEGTSPHLHFEIRREGEPINPYEYLLAAPRLSEPGTLLSTSRSHLGQFRDDDGSVHEADIDALYRRGITRGCNAAGDLYCPNGEITRGEMAAFIRRTLDLPAASTDFFLDDSSNQFSEDIDAVTAAGIGFGCTASEYCADRPLRRDEMAEMLVRAFGFTASSDDAFTDDSASPFEPSIDALKAAGITYGCDPGDPGRYCPDRHLTRAEMASFFIRSLTLLGR